MCTNSKRLVPWVSRCTNDWADPLDGGKWLTRATNEEECLSHIFCREDGDTLTKMSLDECDACGYDDYREAEWQSGYWRNGESVAATWTPKEVCCWFDCVCFIVTTNLTLQFAPTYTFEESVRVNLIQQAFMSAMFQKIGSVWWKLLLLLCETVIIVRDPFSCTKSPSVATSESRWPTCPALPAIVLKTRKAASVLLSRSALPPRPSRPTSLLRLNFPLLP